MYKTVCNWRFWGFVDSCWLQNVGCCLFFFNLEKAMCQAAKQFVEGSSSNICPGTKRSKYDPAVCLHMFLQERMLGRRGSSKSKASYLHGDTNYFRCKIYLDHVIFWWFSHWWSKRRMTCIYLPSFQEFTKQTQPRCFGYCEAEVSEGHPLGPRSSLRSMCGILGWPGR